MSVYDVRLLNVLVSTARDLGVVLNARTITAAQVTARSVPFCIFHFRQLCLILRSLSTDAAKTLLRAPLIRSRLWRFINLFTYLLTYLLTLFQLVWTTAMHLCTESPTTCSDATGSTFKILRRVWSPVCGDMSRPTIR